MSKLLIFAFLFFAVGSSAMEGPSSLKKKRSKKTSQKEKTSQKDFVTMMNKRLRFFENRGDFSNESVKKEWSSLDAAFIWDLLYHVQRKDEPGWRERDAVMMQYDTRMGGISSRIEDKNEKLEGSTDLSSDLSSGDLSSGSQKEKKKVTFEVPKE